MNLTFKKINSITKITKKTKVVNFSVQKNENYFANGVLTHNCYCKRNTDEKVSIATNVNEILDVINRHAYFTPVEKPNQTHPVYTSYDLSCNEDFSLHSKYHNWKLIFDFFRDHPIAMGSFATKFVNKDFLNYNPKQKIRIRFSLMPEKFSKVLEPNTSSISERIKAIKDFQNAGYDVHINYSPVIVNEEWLTLYKELFKQVAKEKVDTKAEVIFLTHNYKKHLSNLGKAGEELLWKPSLQENKVSQYGQTNIRYKAYYKKKFIEDFIKLHDKYLPNETIRYIF